MTATAIISPCTNAHAVRLALIDDDAHGGALLTATDARRLAGQLRRSRVSTVRVPTPHGLRSFDLGATRADVADRLDAAAVRSHTLCALRRNGPIPIDAPCAVSVTPDYEYGRVTMTVSVGEYSRAHALAYNEALAIASSLDKGGTTFTVATPYGDQQFKPDAASARRIAGELRGTVRTVKRARLGEWR